jgi:hypothetical protein
MLLWLPKITSDLKTNEAPINREIMVATTMSSLFVALFALVASSFRTRAALQAEIGKRFPGTRRRDMYCAIEMPSTEETSTP